MYISRLKLVNFEGIRQGLDKREVEINFDVEKKITMLSGGNGSGKSTILSQLQPYKESFDDRKNLIIDGEDGRKEIDIHHNDNFYEIVHIYSSSSQSFIKRNGIELNENGGVKTCEEIISRELGITKNYFNIGRIGSNTKNFIEFTTTERKNYIGTFLNIDELTTAAKIVKEKALATSKDISNLGLELKEQPNEEELLNKLQGITQSISETNDVLNQLYTKKGEISSKIDTIQKEKSEYDFFKMKNEYSEITAQLNKMVRDVEEFLASYAEPENISDEIEKISENLSKLKEKSIQYESELKHIGIRIEETRNDAKKAMMARDACKSVEELERFREEMEKKKAAYEEAKTVAESDPLYSEVRDLFKTGLNTADITSSNRELSDFLISINREFGKYKECTIFKLQNNFNLFMTEQTIKAILKKQIEDLDLLIETQETRLENLRTMISLQESYIKTLNTLELRPANCVDNECPFIKEAYEHRDAPDQLKKLQADLTVTLSALKDHREKRDNIEDLITLEKEFAYRWSKVKTNPLIPLYCKINNLKDFTELITQETLESNLSKEINSFYNNLVEIINKLTSLANKQNSYLIISRDYEKIVSSNDAALREKYENEILDANKKIDSLTLEKAELDRKFLEISDQVKSEQEKHQKYLKYKHSKEAYSSLEEKQKKLSEDMEKYSNLEADLKVAIALESDISSQITKHTSDKFSFEADLLNVNSKITNVRNITERLNKLQEKYKPIETIQNALSTSKGIPLILMQLYLERTELIANELLDLAYGGDFEISFKTSAKDFYIQVRSKENVKSDIKLASQGETSLTAISLSLALIEQSIGEYNILCLDEIDGPLDKNNREKFINILETQIGKLGIEQVFVISHNDAFDACEMNLILLNGSTVDPSNASFMSNKKILYSNF